MCSQATSSAICRPVDWFGLNHYSPIYAKADAQRLLGFAWADAPAGVPKPPIGWQVDPAAFRDTLVDLDRRYRLPIYVLENGAGAVEKLERGRRDRRPERIGYLRPYVAALREAVAAGADVRGYFVWSLLDNFEWGAGYANRFGLVYVDYPTQRRIPKASAHWYARMIHAEAMEAVTMSRILLADIGGTYARFTLAGERSIGRHLVDRGRIPREAIDALRAFLGLDHGDEPIAGALLAAAGPVQGGRCKLTNAAWTLDEEEIARALSAALGADRQRPRSSGGRPAGYQSGADPADRARRRASRRADGHRLAGNGLGHGVRGRRSRRALRGHQRRRPCLACRHAATTDRVDRYPAPALRPRVGRARAVGARTGQSPSGSRRARGLRFATPQCRAT